MIWRWKRWVSFIDGGPCLCSDLKRVCSQASHAALPGRFGYRSRHAGSHSIVHDRGHDLLRRELWQWYKLGNGARSGKQHILGDVGGPYIHGSAKDARQHQGVGDHIGDIRTPGRYNGCPGGSGCFRCNFWIGYGKHKENGAFRHGADHLWGDRVPRREPDDHISATHGISECPCDVSSVRLTGDVHLRPVHIEQAIAIEDTQAITDQEVLKARVQQQVGDANATWTGAIDDDAHVPWLFVNQLERIVQSAKNGSGSRMLFGMQDGDVDGSRQVICNGETAWRSDTTEADAAKGRPQRHTSTDGFLYILCV